MDPLRHIDIRVTGAVQGVGFRYHTRLKAHGLGLTGFVRNEPDGSVYIEAEGHTEPLEALVNWCWHGSQRARVESVRFTEGTMKNFQSFTSVRGQ